MVLGMVFNQLQRQQRILLQAMTLRQCSDRDDNGRAVLTNGGSYERNPLKDVMGGSAANKPSTAPFSTATLLSMINSLSEAHGSGLDLRDSLNIQIVDVILK
jgi:hypothetical protein